MKELIKEIRALTGAGFAECKKAAEASNGDLNTALDFLKKKGIERAAKKVGNAVEHGSVVIKKAVNGNVVILNFKAQTDFAVKSDAFCKFVENEALLWLNSDASTLEEVVGKNGDSYSDRLSFFISTLGENVVLNASKKFVKDSQKKCVTYLHNKINSSFDSVALLGVSLVFNEEADDELCLSIAKHVAACDSLILSEDQITDEIRQEHADINDQILLKQPFFYDEVLTVREVLEKNSIEIFDFSVFVA